MKMRSIHNLRNPLLLGCALALVACGTAHDEVGHAAHGEDPAHEEGHGHDAPARGPHGGRLLEEGGFALEVAIFERGVPPEFRLYATLDGKPVPPQAVAATIALTRVTGVPGGVVDRHAFAPREDHLVSPAEVYEPHSFEAKVEATHAGRTYTWIYDSPEGRVDIAAAAAAAQGIETAAVAAGTIGETLALYGRIQTNAERLRAVTARFPGIVETVTVQAGDAVRAGQTLATVESNESLRSYAVTAPISGTVLKRNTNPGQNAGAEALFEIADFGSVWAELSVFPRDRGRLRAGQGVEITAADGGQSGSGRVGFISPVGTDSQSLVARVVLDNAAGTWTPGQFVSGQVTVARSPAALVVPLTALQSFRDWDVVAVVEGERYQLQPVELGRRDATHAEVLAGLVSGARIVVNNSYLIKADVEKSGAAHDH